MTTDVDDFLAHYGVKGMKWGVVKKKDPDRKSNHRINLEGHYIKKGLSAKDAAISADRRIKVEKAIALAGAATVTAAVAYAAGRYVGREFVDVKLKQGTPLQHITSTGNMQIKDLPLFTTFNKGDKKNIHALFPQTYQVDLSAKTAITAPSNYKARQMLSEVLGKNKTMSSSEYARFNYRYFYDDAPESQKVVSDFFGKVKAAGYNSVLDPKPGGYAVQGIRARLHQPLIVLDADSNVRKIGEKAVSSELYKRAARKVLAKEAALSAAFPLGVASVGLGSAAAVNSRMKVAAIDEYYKKYPNSTYTRSELSAMLLALSDKYVVDNKKRRK